MRSILFFLLLCVSQQGWTQLQADFGSSAQEVCVPNLLQLSDASTTGGAVIVQWEWLNNGVVFSTLPNPALYLNAAGTYAICLRIVDANGNRDTLCRPNYLRAFNGPTVSFNLTNTYGCDPLPVNFSNTTQLGDAPIQQWRWDFGDGTLDTLRASPNHLYQTVGNFDVTLVAIDTNGCRDAQLQSNAVTVNPSVTAAIALSSYQVQCGLPATITFTGISNSRSGLSYNWDLGDSTLTVGQSVTHSYTRSGCFSPTLTVSNAWCSVTATVPSCITVSETPTAAFTLDNATPCTVPFSVQFTNQSTNANSYTWDFGDLTSAGVPNPNHTYSSIAAADSTTYLVGLIPVVLTANNAAGCIARDTQYIRGSLIQSGILRGNLPCAPDTASYTATYSNYSDYSSPVSFQWTLDNAALVTGPSATAFYSDSGSYQVSVIVTDQLGCQDTSSLLVNVGLTPNIDSVTSDTNFVCRLTDIDFVAYGDNFVTSWDWKFSDYSVNFGRGINHNFRDTGFITGILVASFRGCTDTMQLGSYYIYPPVASFFADDTCNSLTVNFIDNSVGAHRWVWDFGDSTTTNDTSSLPNPSYTYPAIDTYYIKLVVYNDTFNCVDTFLDAVILSAPLADFDVVDSICTISTIKPINNSSNSISFIWQAIGAIPFISSNAEPTFLYEEAGVFQLTLSAFAGNGCFDTLQKTIYVAGIDTNIMRAPIPACRPALVNFVDSSQGILSPIVSWQWGNGSSLPTATQVYAFPGEQGMPLQVTNSWGCPFDLVDSFPVGGIFVNYTTNKDICLGNNSTFTALVGSPANRHAFRPFTYLWDFGDGHRDTTSLITTSHLYDSAGVYMVCLEVLDTIGCLSLRCDSVIVHDPTSLFTADTFFSSCPPLEVDFTNLSIGDSSWSWAFGDGSVSSLENPSHVYSTAGFYDVVFAVQAFPGCSAVDTVFQMIQITGPTGQFVSPPGVHCSPHSVELRASGTNIAGYTWLFGNGDFQVHGGGTTDTAFYTYNDVGRFVPTVVLDDGLGCQVSLEGDTLEILPSPVARFYTEPLACGVDSVHYIIDTFSSNWDAIFWSFPQGQPSSSTQFQPWVHYDSTVNAQAQLIVVDGGCADTLLRSDFIRLQPAPLADFDWVYADSCAPATLQFTDQSTILGQDSIQTWQWTFGNGQSATQADTSLQYDSASSYQIQLIVSDSYDCRDTATKSVTLYPAPTLSVTAALPICIGDTLQLQANSNGSVVWHSAHWLSDSNSLTPQTRVDSQQSYYLTATNNFGCQTSDSLLVQPQPYLLAIVPDSGQLCLGDSLSLQANSNGLPLQWRSTAFLSCTNCSTPIVAPSQSSWYYVQVDSSSACVAWDSILIQVNPLPNAAIVADSSICLGDSLSLQALGGGNYIWTINNSTAAQIWSRPTVASSYTVLVQDSFGCLDSAQHRVQIRSIATTPLPDATICLGDSVPLQLSSGNAPTWQAPIYLAALAPRQLPSPAIRLGISYSTPMRIIALCKTACRYKSLTRAFFKP